MKKILGWSLIAGLGVLGLAPLAHAGTDVTMEQVPAAAQATIKKEAAGAHIQELEKDTHKGKTIYEATFMKDGSKVEIEVTPEGKILKRTVETRYDQPAAPQPGAPGHAK